MSNTACPHCGEKTITTKERLKASHWLEIYCPSCGGRIAMQPLVLTLVYFLIVWDFVLFGFLTYYEKSVMYATVMTVGWLILEYFAYFVPLSRLRAKQPKNG